MEKSRSALAVWVFRGEILPPRLLFCRRVGVEISLPPGENFALRGNCRKKGDFSTAIQQDFVGESFQQVLGKVLGRGISTEGDAGERGFLERKPGKELYKWFALPAFQLGELSPYLEFRK